MKRTNLLCTLIVLGCFLSTDVHSKGNEILINLHDPELVKAHQPLLIAHRGGVVTDTAPENSIPAIDLAAERGYAMVEVDIRQTKDGLPVAFHDNNMMQDVGIDNVIENLTFDEISKLRYKGTDERIITLDEYLKHSTQYKMGVMLDIKVVDANRNDESFFKGIADLIDKYGLENATVTISREPLAAKYLQGKALLRMSEEEADAIGRGKPVDVSGKFWFDWPRFITNEMVELIQQQGSLVIPSINLFQYDLYPKEEQMGRAKKDIERMIETGVDGYQIDGVYDKYF